MRKYFSLCFWFFALTLAGQQLIYREIELSEGLRINRMSQDSFGFIWMATNKGVVVYDGYDDQMVLRHTPHEIDFICHHKGLIYAGSHGGDIFILNAETRKAIDTLHSFTRFPISDIEFTASDSVIVSSYGDGVYMLLGDKVISKLSALSSVDIYDMVLKQNGELFLASDKGIDIFKSSSKGFVKKGIVENLPDYIIVKMCLNQNDDITAATYDKSVFKIEGPEMRIRTIYQNPKNEKIHNLVHHRENLFIHAGNRILDHHDGQSTVLNLSENQQRATSLFVDNENNLWLATGKSTVLKSNLYFMNFRLNLRHEVQAILYHNLTFFLGTEKGIYKNSAITASESEAILPAENITVLRLIGNYIWIGTFSNGLFLYEPTTRKVIKIGKLLGLDDNTILDMEKVAKNVVEISTLAGVKSMAIDARGLPTPGNKSIDDVLTAYVFDIYVDKQGNKWYGKDRNGIGLISTQGKFEIKSILNQGDGKKYKLGSVYSIAEGNDSSVYFASVDLGIVRYTSGKWYIVPNTFSIKNHISSLVRFGNNQMLVIRTSTTDIIDLGDNHVLPFANQGYKDNIIPFLNNYTHAGNDIYFCAGGDVVRFSPAHGVYKKHPVTLLEKIEVNLESVPRHTSAFSQQQNNLRFTFTAGWISNPVSIQYAYKLHGFDTEWRVTRDRVVSYPHLRPGNYTFVVKASENNYFSDEPIAKYTFRIHRAFYTTWWFFSLLALVTGLLFYWLQQKQKNMALLKSELARKMVETELINLKSQLDPHFLFNTLNTLIGLIEEDPQRGIRFTENLTDFFRSLSQMGNKELVTLTEELSLLTSYRNILKERFGQNLVVFIHEEVHQRAGDILIPPMTLQMIVENAVKHNEVSRQKPLQVDIAIKGEYLIVSNQKNLKISRKISLGIGNHNILERYRFLGQKMPRIEEHDNVYTFLLPIIANVK
ncbi:MAG: histidine kinase [Saprospiraceae bacterium]|nr:histidine kinase [Saprospiraceae bacterium]